MEEQAEPNERMKLANLAAQAAERRLSVTKGTTDGNLPQEQIEISTLRARLERYKFLVIFSLSCEEDCLFN